MGDWYYNGDGKRQFQALDVFRCLEIPHQQVHQNGLAGLQAAEDGRTDVAIRCFEDMENASSVVLDLLSRLQLEMSVQLRKIEQ